MHNREQIQQRLDELIREYGSWANDIPLLFDVWTRGNLRIPHTRLKRIVQAVSDLSKKPISECRILDLGCLDGMFSIEFALQGADTIGVEIREANIKKALFCKEVLNLQNLDFRRDDVRNISVESYGRFDAIICSGILYHLPSVDAINLIRTMHEMSHRLVVIDTHVALEPIGRVLNNGDEYWGDIYREHPDDSTPEEKAKRPWASADNPLSFWFTRPSLVNILSKAGFSSVYECFTPAHLNYGKPGLEHQNRCTFIALKDDISELKTSPEANGLQERWPEGSLSYAPKSKTRIRRLYKRVLLKLKGMRA
ncbi:MAG TPA: class I SAM-dependent methyltransferase [Nitrospirota bacterium]|nr:class I SAM-dependent methyltransferase [Nitrospirota bacterium]